MLEKIYQIIRKNPIDKTALTNLLPILKELDEFEFYHPVHPYPVLEHSIKAAQKLDDDFLRLVLIFHDVGKLKTSVKVPHYTKPNAFVMKSPNHEIESAKIVEELFKKEMDLDSLKILLALIKYHDTPLINEADDTIMQQLIKEYGLNFVSNLLKIQRADMSTHSKEYYEQKMKPKLDYAENIFKKNIQVNSKHK